MPATVGAALRQERVRQGRTHADVAQELGVPKATVVDLEEGNLAAGVRAQAYVRVYARTLGLDAEELLRRLAVEQDAVGTGPVGTASGGAPAPGPPAPPAVQPLGANVQGSGRRKTDGRRRRLRVALLAGLGLLAAAVGAGVVLLASGSGRDAPTPENDGASPSRAGLPPAHAVQETAGRAPADRTPADRLDAGDGAARAVTPPGRSPAQTTVQVLHAGADDAVVGEVTRTLEALGYRVVLVSPARLALDATTVYYVEGWDAEAAGLRARDPRFVETAPNPGFAADVGLHVAIGPDWHASGAQTP